MYYQIKFDNKTIRSLKDTEETVMIIWTLVVILTLTIANQPSCMTLWLMMMHQNTKFGNKMFFGLKDIIWTSTDVLTLCCDLDLDCISIFFKKHSGLWCCITTSSLATKCSLILNPCCDLDPESSNPIFSTEHSDLWCSTIKLSLVANGQAV